MMLLHIYNFSSIIASIIPSSYIFFGNDLHWSLVYYFMLIKLITEMILYILLNFVIHGGSKEVYTRDRGLEDRPRSRGQPRDLIEMASVSVLVSAIHVSVSVLVSEVP